MRACWPKWVGRDWSISADYIWLNFSDTNSGGGGDLLLVCVPALLSVHAQQHLAPERAYISCHLLTASAGSERAIAADLYPCPSSRSPMAAFLASTSCFTLKSTRIKKASHFSCQEMGGSSE